MDRTTSVDEQVRANLAKLDAVPAFVGDRLWLTFYLSGPPANLWLISEALASNGWHNTDGWEGAFLYPKVEVNRTATAIVDLAESTKALCDPHQVEILNIDADTSPDVQRSQFVTLYRSD
jgi:hypothetical protein